MARDGSGTGAMAAPGAIPARDAVPTGGPRLASIDLAGLPSLETDLAPGKVVETLESAARRGRLAGFRHGANDTHCRVRLFGWVLDRELHVEAAPAGAASSRETRVSLRTTMLKRNPAVLIVAMLFTIWPGVWLMDSMLLTYIPSAQGWWPTWTWYLPLTILPMPWAIRAVLKRSREAATQDARKAIETIIRELDARIAD